MKTLCRSCCLSLVMPLELCDEERARMAGRRGHNPLRDRPRYCSSVKLGCHAGPGSGGRQRLPRSKGEAEEGGLQSLVVVLLLRVASRLGVRRG
jgi:hypothetical protein